jgi:hypothetical protein
MGVDDFGARGIDTGKFDKKTVGGAWAITL